MTARKRKQVLEYKLPDPIKKVQKEVHPVGCDLDQAKPSLSSKEIRDKVEKARMIQQKRYEDVEGINSNAQMSTPPA